MGFLKASFDRGLLQWCVLVNQSVEVDCEDHVVPPVKFLEPYDSNQSAASLTLHENDAVHVQLTSGTSSSNREEEKPPEPITGFGSRAGKGGGEKKLHQQPFFLWLLVQFFFTAPLLEQRTAMHRVWVASFADIYQPGI